jgi:hypothetical protein
MDSSYPREQGANRSVYGDDSHGKHGHEARARVGPARVGSQARFSADRHEDVRMKRYKWSMAAIVVAVVVVTGVAILTEP